MPIEFLPIVPSIPVHLLTKSGLNKLLGKLPEFYKNWSADQGFKAEFGQSICLPDKDGYLDCVFFGIDTVDAYNKNPFAVGQLVNKLPEGNYHLTCAETAEAIDLELAALSWLLSSYRFTKYKDAKKEMPKLVAPEGIDTEKIKSIAKSCHRAMDLINRPANDLSPKKLADEVHAIKIEHNVNANTITGNALLNKNFPLIHAVGRAGSEEPRLVDIRWGKPEHPKVTIIGKGITFDTGGLDIKPSSSMGLMKKDMGGAANALALAHMIIENELPLNLRLLIPIAENGISNQAFRPGDIIKARNGKTVEVNNTDAEGRLILADALAYAAEETPDLLISLATLTGAARVALGPDVPPFFTDDDELAAKLSEHSEIVHDPIWRLPFWQPYEEMLKTRNADLDNAPKGGMAGAITAALFLRHFTGDTRYVHFDIFGWTPNAKPGRPFGGAAQAIRAIFSYLEQEYGG